MFVVLGDVGHFDCVTNTITNTNTISFSHSIPLKHIVCNCFRPRFCLPPKAFRDKTVYNFSGPRFSSIRNISSWNAVFAALNTTTFPQQFCVDLWHNYVIVLTSYAAASYEPTVLDAESVEVTVCRFAVLSKCTISKHCSMQHYKADFLWNKILAACLTLWQFLVTISPPKF